MCVRGRDCGQPVFRDRDIAGHIARGDPLHAAQNSEGRREIGAISALFAKQEPGSKIHVIRRIGDVQRVIVMTAQIIPHGKGTTIRALLAARSLNGKSVKLLLHMRRQGCIDLSDFSVARVGNRCSFIHKARGSFAVGGEVQISERIAVPRRQFTGQEELRSRVEIRRHASRAQFQRTQALRDVQGGRRRRQHVYRRAFRIQGRPGEGQVFIEHSPAVALLQQIRVQETAA